jgi:hypothetical protein
LESLVSGRRTRAAFRNRVHSVAVWFLSFQKFRCIQDNCEDNAPEITIEKTQSPLHNIGHVLAHPRSPERHAWLHEDSCKRVGDTLHHRRLIVWIVERFHSRAECNHHQSDGQNKVDGCNHTRSDQNPFLHALFKTTLI